MKYAVLLAVALSGTLGSVCSASQYVLVTHMEARAYVAYIAPLPDGECVFGPDSPGWTSVECVDTLASETGLDWSYVDCVLHAPSDACVGASWWGEVRAGCSWNGVDRLSLGGVTFRFGSTTNSLGGSAAASVRLLRRTYIGVENDYCGGASEPPCGGSIAAPGTIGFSRWAGKEWPTFVYTFVPLPVDVDADGTVNASDIAAVLAAWGDLKQDNFADTNLDGRVDAVDLVRVLSGWGGDGRE